MGSFIMIFTFGMLNMIVALVVEKTLEQSRLMSDLKKIEMMKILREELLQVRTAFMTCDQDGSGSLSKDEFEKALDDDTVGLRRIFEKYQLDVRDASELFVVLDWDNTGEISVEELV